MIPLRDNLPTTGATPLTLVLIAINVLAYFLWQHGGILSGPSDTHIVEWGWIPWEWNHQGQQCAVQGQEIICGQGIDGRSTAATALTSMFMHGSILHLAGNMLFLWIFGNNVEDSLGPVRFVLFYLIAGVAALALQTALTPDGTEAMVPMVGASGAIAGVLGGYLMLYPRARVLTVVFIILFFTIVEVPALVMLGFWIIAQTTMAATGISDAIGGSGGGVAYFAHVGGFACGLLLIRLLKPRINPAYARFLRS